MKSLIHKFFTGNYNFLLILLFILFILRPYEYHPIYVGAWKTVLTITLIVAILNCAHKRFVQWTISILAIPTLIVSWVNIFYETKDGLTVLAILTILFMFICVSSILYDVLLKARVTFETLRGVVCAYFLIAFMFAYIYLLLENIAPGTISVRERIVPVLPYAHYISDMLYFSFVTLLTIGYGDIVAIKEWGQTATVLEGIVGQFYIAILVARIVAVYSLLSDKRLLKQLESDLHEGHSK